MSLPRPVPPLAAALLVLALAAAGCGGGGGGQSKGPIVGKRGGEKSAATDLGFPVFATKNTTRVGGGDATADAAGVSRAVYSGTTSTTRPTAVALVNSGDWQAGVAASVLMSPPIRAPLLLSDAGSMPAATSAALAALDPTGSKPARGAKVIRVGNVPKAGGLRTVTVPGRSPAALAQGIDRFQTAAFGHSSDRVLVVSSEKAAFAMPAAAWAAKAGDSIFFVTRDGVPRETVAALKAHQQPKIYVLGPANVVSDGVLAKLRKLGTVRRISGRDPVTNAIAFARYVDGNFGWGVVDPGHGLVFANADRPLDAAAAAPLSSAGTYGPLLLTSGGRLPVPLVQYLLDIQPGYAKDPVRGVYNHGWLMGDEGAISAADQSRIDSLLEIIPVSSSGGPSQPAS
jgi:ell wall binding domain 2 (CWB2)